MSRFLNDNFGNKYDCLSDNYLTKPSFESKIFEPLPIIDTYKPIERDFSINSNGYGLGETTSLGFSPNPKIDTFIFGGGMHSPHTNALGAPINHNIGAHITPPAYAGTSLHGNFAPNANFMQPAVSQPLNINMAKHP